MLAFSASSTPKSAAIAARSFHCCDARLVAQHGLELDDGDQTDHDEQSQRDGECGGNLCANPNLQRLPPRHSAHDEPPSCATAPFASRCNALSSHRQTRRCFGRGMATIRYRMGHLGHEL
jgi:hypothetical protein